MKCKYCLRDVPQDGEHRCVGGKYILFEDGKFVKSKNQEKTAWLLIDRNPELPYSEQYILFADFEECVDEAVTRGLDTGWLGRNRPKKGHMHSQQGGSEDIDISYIEVTLPGDSG